MQPHDFQELVLGLVIAAIEMGVVLAEAAHPHQPRQSAARLVPIDLAIFRQPDRQVAIAVLLGQIDLMVMRAVHRPQIEMLTVDLERLVHVFRIIGQMSRAVIKFLLGDMRRHHPQVAVAPLFLLGQEFQLVTQCRAARQP